ncbi:MAG: cob(I)yrinic acid a,c-diamide adenosyltransferase [Armatimonadetes bacterium]|nr:cob(I)yrinic acid a,c-diamide adenosyltransferase [Armatimonadota bacterium]
MWRRRPRSTRRYCPLTLDELNCAIVEGHVTPEEVLSLFAGEPRRLSVMMTGRGAPQEPKEAASMVTEMRSMKHASSQGIPGREGLEY